MASFIEVFYHQIFNNPRRHLLTREECARLKAVIRRRLKTNNYECRLPDARCYRRHDPTKVHDMFREPTYYKPVYRLRLRTEKILIKKRRFIGFTMSSVRVWR